MGAPSKDRGYGELLAAKAEPTACLLVDRKP